MPLGRGLGGLIRLTPLQRQGVPNSEFRIRDAKLGLYATIGIMIALVNTLTSLPARLTLVPVRAIMRGNRARGGPTGLTGS